MEDLTPGGASGVVVGVDVEARAALLSRSCIAAHGPPRVAPERVVARGSRSYARRKPVLPHVFYDL